MESNSMSNINDCYSTLYFLTKIQGYPLVLLAAKCNLRLEFHGTNARAFPPCLHLCQHKDIEQTQ